MKSVLWLVMTAFVLLTAEGAWAHRYIPYAGDHISAETAIPLRDIDVSQVAYHTATEAFPRVWFWFDAKADQIAKIQLGVPLIERFRDYRPAFALLGPGLPELALPFPAPEGLGGVLYSTESVVAPEVFHEEFTGTASWIFEMQSIRLPETGRYYLVAFASNGAPGKFWIAPGTLESFGIKDIAILPWVIYKVRTFHEVFPFGGLLAWGMVGALFAGLALLS